ncbi:MAG: helix-turn-helix transcriptional regulator [bacterium]
MKYKRKAVFVDIKEVEEIIKKLQGEVRKLRKKAEKKIQKEVEREKLLGAEELAKMLGLHKYTIYELVKNDGLPVVKIYPRALRFSWPDVQKWLKKRSLTVEEKMRLISERKREKEKKRQEGVNESKNK